MLISYFYVNFGFVKAQNSFFPHWRLQGSIFIFISGITIRHVRYEFVFVHLFFYKTFIRCKNTHYFGMQTKEHCCEGGASPEWFLMSERLTYNVCHLLGRFLEIASHPFFEGTEKRVGIDGVGVTPFCVIMVSVIKNRQNNLS